MVALPEISSPTVEAIYKTYEDAGNKPYNMPRVGAHNAGAECARKLWLGFHWASPPKQFSGRMLKLFSRGHHEEPIICADLRNAGVTVMDVDPATGKQWEFVDETGHIVCRIDAAVIGLLEAPATYHVGEFKTHNKDSFKALKKDGVEKSKPEHYAQCQLGMHFSGMKRAYYVALCKDNDEYWSKRFEYDAEYCMRLVSRLQRIVMQPRPPDRDCQVPDFYKAKFCDHRETCFLLSAAPRNCRTCLHSEPREGAVWHCNKHDWNPDRDEQRVGCDDHRYILDFVDGKQEDIKGEDIIYAMRDGTTWHDEGPYHES